VRTIVVMSAVRFFPPIVAIRCCFSSSLWPSCHFDRSLLYPRLQALGPAGHLLPKLRFRCFSPVRVPPADCRESQHDCHTQKVVGEWHSMRSGVPVRDIFDVIFQNRCGCPFLHCCRKEHLTPVPLSLPSEDVAARPVRIRNAGDHL
jgi:hypothetical protein